MNNPAISPESADTAPEESTTATDAISARHSVDPLEIEKFNRFAETWWDATGPMWPLHRLNQLRTGYITDQITQHFDRDKHDALPLSGLHILDIGCGGGLLSEAMAALGASVHGVDISDRNIAVATRHATGLQNPPQYELTTAEALYERGERYDVVLNMEVVEHVADLPAFMHACSGMVKPGGAKAGGMQIVSTINRNPISWFSAIFGAEYILKWLPKGTHQYLKLVKPAELQALLDRDNMDVIASTGVFVNPLNRKMSLSRSQMINYMKVAVKSSA